MAKPTPPEIPQHIPAAQNGAPQMLRSKTLDAADGSTPERARSTPALPQPQLTRLCDLLGAWQSEAQAAYDARVKGVARGPVTGLAELDRHLGGVLAPGLHIIHGQPGTGKSAFVLQVAASCGCPSLLLSCEMSALELLRRHTARETGTYLGRLKSGELAPEASLELARRACAAAPHLALADGTSAYASALWLHDAAQIARGDAGHLLLIVDSVHSWAEGALVEASEYDTLNAGLRALRQLAQLLNCPIIAVAERNRDSMKSGGMSAGAGTRKIEYGAETVLDLDCEANAPVNVHGEKAVRVRVTKNRHGATHAGFELLFNGALQKFSSPEK